MLSVETMINDICNVGVLINNQVKLAKANEKQFKTLNERVIIVVTTLRGRSFELIEEKSDYYQTNLKLLYDYLNQCLEFMKKFSINNSLQHLLLKTSDYSDQFKQLNQNLQTAIIQLNLAINVQLIFDQEQDRRDHNDDIIANQTIIETNTALLKHLLKQQVEESFMSSTHAEINRGNFLSYKELEKKFQDQIFFINEQWDSSNDKERYKLLIKLNLTAFSYNFIKIEFKHKLSVATQMYRHGFVYENNQHPSTEECWYACPELHLDWINNFSWQSQEQRCFFSYRELPIKFQDEILPVLTRKNRDDIKSEWDGANNESCYTLLEKSKLTHLNYDFLTRDFKVGLSAITKFQRHALVDEKGQYPSIKQFWNDHPELHRTWIKHIPF